MVYCTKCGTKNDDTASVCSKCSISLQETGEAERHRRVEAECFGLPRGGTIVGLAIGIIILLAGSIWFLQQSNLISQNIEVWPFVAIIFGVLIIVGALYGRRYRY